MNNGLRASTDGTLYAVVWDDGAGTLHLNLADDATPTADVLNTTLTGPGFGTMYHPDIIVGGDYSFYYVMAVYTVNNGGATNIFTETYMVTGVGSGTGLALVACGTPVRQVANTGTAGDAHIDIANDPQGVVFTVADTFVIAWEDMSCTQNTVDPGARAVWGSLAQFAGTGCNTAAFHGASGCLNNTNAITGHSGMQVDIAVRRDYTNGGFRAYFAYDDKGLGWVYQGQWHFPSPNVVATGAQIDPTGANNMDFPRIDVPDDVTTSPYFVADVVYRYWDGLIWQVVQNNAAIGPDIVTNYFNGPPDHDNSNPVVTRGTGSTFATAFANTAMGEIYSADVDWNTGNLTSDFVPLSYDLYQVSMSNDIDGPVAISNDYLNTGGGPYPNEEMVCWYNTHTDEIDCKLTAAYTPVFKPAQVIVMKEGSKTVAYPNPTRDMIYLKTGANGAESYSIRDLPGREVMQGKISTRPQPVNLGSLANGTYLLYVTNARGEAEVSKILKN
ncbi:MAG: T9SS type A sorting domain-containing protein [Bacteroidetes bacterium]|nr:T9SS type A sorting domain-containing protein [Bacteroidota bacterium]